MVKEKEYKVEVVDKDTFKIQTKIDELTAQGWLLHSQECIKDGTSPAYEQIQLIFEKKVV
jgi:hypothetical protein